MLLLEKYGTDKENNKFTYVMIPSNHVLRFPYNSEDYITLLKSKLTSEIKLKINISVTSQNKKTGPEKGYPTYYLIIKDDPKLKDYEKFLTGLTAVKEKDKWIITID